MEFQLSNDRIIAYHRSRQDYVDAPENTLRFAYGDLRYEKMTKDLTVESDILKLKTLEEINEDFRRADFINLALMSSDILAVLIQHLRDKSDPIRELASRSLVQVCSLKYGREKVIENAYIHHIAELIDDYQPQIRTNSYDAMNNLAEFRDGAEHILIAEKLPSFVDKLIEEKVESILIKVLQLIKKILEGQNATETILKTQAITRLTTLLEHQNSKIRELSAKNLASISFLDLGKIKEIELKCVLPLCKRLDDEVSSVREAASLGLASLAQRNEAKHEILDYSYFARIMELLDDSSKHTQLNIIQLIASVAEHPVGRKKAKICLEKLQTLMSDPMNEFLAPYIKGTIDVITWIP